MFAQQQAPIDYKRLGDEACDRFLSSGTQSLKEIICDIAKAEELNPQEIARVCQRANTKVLLRLFKEGDDKTIEFEVADPKEVVKALSLNTIEETPIAAPEPVQTEPDVNLPDAGSFLDYRELENLIFQLEDEITRIKTKLYDDRPTLVRHLASRIHNYGPKAVIISFKKVAGPESLLKEAFKTAGTEYDDSDFDLDHYLVNDKDDLLQKVAAYGSMMTTVKRLETHLEKLSALRSVVKNPLGTLTVVGELAGVADKTKSHKDLILGKVKNPPRIGKPGNTGYIKSP